MKRIKGFTLLEMMIAMAILSGALTWLVVGMSRNISAENHAKLVSTATFLARERMVDFEDELYEKGFGEFEKELSGNFEDKGFARFTWKVIVDKVELPSSEQIQTVMTKAQENKGDNPDDKSKLPPQMQNNNNSSASNNPLTAGAGALASQFGIIKDVLEQGIRRVTVKILWKEGKLERDVTVVAYYTDVRKVDQAIQVAASGPSGPSGPSK
jgi:prepilin-type N-terminal cleavage/methylation domain-containing protein